MQTIYVLTVFFIFCKDLYIETGEGSGTPLQ